MERIRRHLSYANVAATLALVFAMGGGAIAATGGFSSGGKLQACVNEEGRMKLLQAGQHCKKGQKGVSWNQVGPAGAPGATGATGAPGAPGAPGPIGHEGLTGKSANTKWAAVAFGPELEAGEGVESVTGSGGTYQVHFDSSVAGCAVVATQNSNTSNFVAGSAHVRADPTEVEVSIRDFSSGAHAAAFSIVAFC